MQADVVVVETGVSVPIQFLRRLSSSTRSRRANLQLAHLLAFVAGAVNAGGFLAVKQYTSHMTGIVSSLADNAALGDSRLALSALGALLSFLCGAACTAVLVNWGRRHSMVSEYATPLMLEALLLSLFGLVGGNLEHHRWLFVPATVMLLCFIMGLQNAIITKISQAEIRTTHLTGMVTDIGIELGKLLYWNRFGQGLPAVQANRGKLAMLSSQIGMFFMGALLGALGFKHIGFIATLPLAALLLLMAVVPVFDDLHTHLRRRQQ